VLNIDLICSHDYLFIMIGISIKGSVLTKVEASLWIVYLIETDGGLYCGITTDMERRYQQHCKGTGLNFFVGQNRFELLIQKYNPTGVGQVSENTRLNSYHGNKNSL